MVIMRYGCGFLIFLQKDRLRNRKKAVNISYVAEKYEKVMIHRAVRHLLSDSERKVYRYKNDKRCACKD